LEAPSAAAFGSVQDQTSPVITSENCFSSAASVAPSPQVLVASAALVSLVLRRYPQQAARVEEVGVFAVHLVATSAVVHVTAVAADTVVAIRAITANFICFFKFILDDNDDNDNDKNNDGLEMGMLAVQEDDDTETLAFTEEYISSDEEDEMKSWRY